MKRLTPVLLVEAIEPVLPFWVERLGFEQTAEVKEGDRLGFVILQKGAVQLMYQTRESVRNDVPELGELALNASAVFIEVDDLDAVIESLQGVEPVVPRRQTFYGADEYIVRDPVGNVVTFAFFGSGDGA